MCARGENYTQTDTQHAERETAHIQSEGRRKGERACFAEHKMMLGNQESDSLLSTLENSCITKKVMQLS
jgi:hypothetical protein